LKTQKNINLKYNLQKKHSFKTQKQTGWNIMNSMHWINEWCEAHSSYNFLTRLLLRFKDIFKKN
jgi:hypothetical protein